MNPTGVRLQCDNCGFSTVVTEEITKEEFGLPPGVTRREGNVFFCHNCGSSLQPVASVDTTPRERVPDPDALTADQRLEKILQQQQAVDAAKAEHDDAKEEAASAKKRWEATVETLGVIIRRLTQVPGEAPPLLAIAEQPEESCGSLSPAGIFCDRLPGHDGPHSAQGQDEAAEAETWPQSGPAEAGQGDGNETPIHAAAAATVRVRVKQLADVGVTVTVEQVDAWSLDEYNDVASYLYALQNDPHTDHERPACLPEPVEPARQTRRRKRADVQQANA